MKRSVNLTLILLFELKCLHHMECKPTSCILQHETFCRKPKVDKGLYALATLMRDGTEQASAGNTNVISDSAIEAVFHAYIETAKDLGSEVSLVEHIAMHVILCFFEQPNKAMLLKSFVRSKRLQELLSEGADKPLETTLFRILFEAMKQCDSMFLLERSVWLVSLFEATLPDSILAWLHEKANSLDESMSRSAKVVLLLSRNQQDKPVSEITQTLPNTDWTNNIYFPFVSTDPSAGFGAGVLYLNAKGTSFDANGVPNGDFVQSAFNEITSKGSSDTEETTPSESTHEVKMPQTSIPAGNFQFCLVDALQKMVAQSIRDDPHCAMHIQPSALLKRFTYIRHILWSSRMDARACAFALLHADDECFLPCADYQSTRERKMFATMLNIFCVLEDYFALPWPVLASWSPVPDKPSNSPNTELFFTIRVLTILICLPNSLNGDVISITLLNMWTHLYSSLHRLDIEIIDRLRTMICGVVSSLGQCFPWELWHSMTTAMVDSRILVCRKLFLFELLRDLADHTFPGRVRKAIPASLHGFLPKWKEPNQSLISDNVFRNVIQSADCEAIRELQKLKKQSFETHSCAEQLLDCILKISHVSLSYQKQLLETFKPIFTESLGEAENEKADEQPPNLSIVLLDHVYKFWTNNHSCRLQSIFHLLEIGIVAPASVPLWLESPSLAGVWEQSWVRQVALRAAHRALRKWAEANALESAAAQELKAFFYHVFLVLQRNIASLSDTEDDEIAEFAKAADFGQQPKAHWSGRNVVRIQSSVGLFRWLVRLYFAYGLPRIWPEHEKQIRDIVFSPGPCHDFLAKIWRVSLLNNGCLSESSDFDTLKKEIERLNGGKHAAYRRYIARKAKQKSVS